MTPAEPVFQLPDAELVRQHGRVAAVRAGLEAVQPGPARTAHRPLGPSLRIAVLVPRTDVGGGTRILLELSDRLLARGHRVSVLSYAPPPDWFDLRSPFTQVPVGMSLAHAVPACDLVLAGYWELVPEVAALQVAPVVHVEQGDFHLFEDLPAPLEALVRRTLALADAHTVVSSTVGRILQDRYGVEADVVPNAVDPAVFHPLRVGEQAGPGRRTVLAVGWDGNAFKGIDAVRAVATRLRRTHPDVEVVWVTPKPPQDPPGAIGRVVVSPEQHELAALYREASAYLCASEYESFPLPPMEAMSCGTPVVSTANPGSLEYCRDGENALLVSIGDEEAMHVALTRVLDDDALSARLTAAGAATAASYTWEAVVDRAEEVYRRTAEAGAPAGGRGWRRVGGVEPACGGTSEGAERLAAVLARSGAARVLVPVTRHRADGLLVHRWEVAHERPDGLGDVRVHVLHLPPGSAPAPGGGNGPADALDALDRQLGDGRIDEALARVSEALSAAPPRGLRGPLLARAALCLMATDRSQQSLELLISAWSDHPDHPDLFALAVRAAHDLGATTEPGALEAVLAATGRGARYDEWLARPADAVHRPISSSVPPTRPMALT